MPERVLGAIGERHLVNHFGGDQRRHVRVVDEVASRSVSNRNPITDAAFSVCLRGGGQAVDAGADRRLQVGRHIDVVDVAAVARTRRVRPSSTPRSARSRTISSAKNGFPAARSTTAVYECGE